MTDVVSALSSLLAVSSDEEEVLVLSSLVKVLSCQPSDWRTRMCSPIVDGSPTTQLEALVIYTLARKFALTTKSARGVVDMDLVVLQHPPTSLPVLDGSLAQLHTLLQEPTWSEEALTVLIRLIPRIEDPRLRQHTLTFAMDRASASVKSAQPMVTQEIVVVAARLLVLGITDVWSAIRKESARRLGIIVAQFPTMTAIDEFIGTVVALAASHDWKKQEGALLAIDALIQSFTRDVTTTSATQDADRITRPAVQDLIKGSFSSSPRGSVDSSPSPSLVVRFHIGERHRDLSQLPRTLVAKLKPTVYLSLKHEQLSVREVAAQALVHYMEVCDEVTRLLTFQEVMSKLNRLNTSSPSDGVDLKAKSSMPQLLSKDSPQHQELLDAAEAEGLLDVLAKLVPAMPLPFLIKHWAFIFPILERYVMHIASSVRQKSSAVVLALAEQSQQPRGTATAPSGELDLLMQMMLAIAETREDHGVCWQRLEGRLLSVELLANLLGKNHLWTKEETPSRGLLHIRSTPRASVSVTSVTESLDEGITCANLWLPDEALAQATWTIDDEDEEARLQQCVPFGSPSLIELISRRLETNAGTAGAFWGRVIRGWLLQTYRAFISTQFELRRISRQLLPALIRLCVWCRQLPLLTELNTTAANGSEAEAEAGSWRWTCLRHLLLHTQLVHEAGFVTGNAACFREQMASIIHDGKRFARECVASAIGSENSRLQDTEGIVARVEVLMLGFLSFSEPSDTDHSNNLLHDALQEIHPHLTPSFQVTSPQTSCVTPANSSLDRQLCIALVKFLPSICLRVVGSCDITPDDLIIVESVRVLLRIALSWLASDDMFRWITIDKTSAQDSLLASLSVLSAAFCRHLLADDVQLVDHTIHSVLIIGAASTRRLRDTVYRSSIEIYVSLWKALTEIPSTPAYSLIVSRLLELVDRQETTSPSKTVALSVASEWDAWDEDGEYGQDAYAKNEVVGAQCHGATKAYEVRSSSAADSVQDTVESVVLDVVTRAWTLAEMEAFQIALRSHDTTACSSLNRLDATMAMAMAQKPIAQLQATG